MEKKSKFGALMSNAGKSAKSLLDSAVHAADQNDDGKFDLSDVSAIAGSMGSAVKKGTQAMKESAEEKARQLELKTLQPIFPSLLDSSEFFMPKFIRVADRDKKRAESEVCQGSIGYFSDVKGIRVINLFRDSVDLLGLTFFPDCNGEFYYVDPTDREFYISLDEYFGYLKVVRVNELKKIAQDLGAKYFRVTYMEEKTSFSAKDAKGAAKATAIGKVDVSSGSEEQKYEGVKIEAETSFPGHAPTKPRLKYLQRDPTIQTLVAMRMDESSPLIKEKYMLKMSQSSGIKENDAVQIDAVLKGMKCSGNTTVESEAKHEARRYLEYVIEFE